MYSLSSPSRFVRFRRLAAAGFLTTILATPGLALDQLEFNTPGAPDDLAGALRGASVLLSEQREGATNDQDYFAAAQTEYGRLLGALYAAGYYSGVINVLIDGREAASIAPLDAPTSIRRISVTVKPGPQFRFSRAEVAPLAKGTTLPEGFAAGKTAESGLMKDAAEAAVSGWRDVGHAKATPDAQSIVADHRRAEIDARFHIAPGPRLRFGKLAVEGNKRVRTERIHAIAGLPEGEVFSPKSIETSAKRLRRAGAFSAVTFSEAEAANPDGTLDITATVVEEKRRRYGFGAEISSSEGLRVNGYWMHRNLFGGAERLRIEGEVENIGGAGVALGYSLKASFARPATFTPDTTLTLDAEAAHLSFEDFSADVLTLEAGLTHIFSDTLTGNAGLFYGRLRAKDDTATYLYSIVATPLELTWDKRDDRLDPRNGYYLSGELIPYLGLDDAESGARLSFDARAFKGFGTDDRFVLAGRVQGGGIFGSSLLGTPRDLLFYSGGGGSVRGQPFQSLGVTEPTTGEQMGGRSFLALSGELRTDITKNIGLVAFYDTGFVSAGSFSSSGGEWHSGAGLGLRYQTGIGPIRLDVAAPVSGNTGEGVQFYIGIGQAF